MRHDDEPVEEGADERAAAEALARALEGDGGSQELPDDALEAAALLRYSRDGGELSAERQRAILAELLAHAPGLGAGRRPTPWRGWLAAFGGAAASAAGVIALLLVMPSGSPGPVSLPPPDLALLQAQGEAVTGSAEDLRREMRSYRQELYAALGRHYGAAP